MASDGGTMNMIFGELWDAPVCDEAIPVDTPVGVECLRCGQPILDGEQGFIRPCYTGSTRTGFGLPDRCVVSVCADKSFALTATHRECDLAGVVGHMVGVCSCTGWESSSRAAAREVLRRVEAGALRQ